ncbi:hypothetical protein [Stakelama pacifica]|uniref:Uncharacterized protein n=1 Tax=Stakelama pacifica TaxID=517720 RepID=A0A4R6FNU1_9SPHN|nr:hypothetical protein [Stakelama pacifica]TDN82345.1 hypothetical protein EV664_106154 [Stakelama pacifica]GGO95575.1 hypothetical protein GCM10011329_20050 [Stakelama pacifica]
MGFMLLIVCACAVWGLRRCATDTPPHAPDAIEIALAAVVVLTGEAGAALLIEGDTLFRTYVPPKYRQSGRD